MIRFILFLVAALFCGRAFADDFIARQGADSVRLTAAACPAEIAAVVPESWRDKAQAAHAIVNGKQYPACWAARSDGWVILQYADGDVGMARLESFRRAPGV
jgi:hypothetical protein